MAREARGQGSQAVVLLPGALAQGVRRQAAAGLRGRPAGQWGPVLTSTEVHEGVAHRALGILRVPGVETYWKVHLPRAMHPCREHTQDELMVSGAGVGPYSAAARLPIAAHCPWSGAADCGSPGGCRQGALTHCPELAAQGRLLQVGPPEVFG